MSKLSRLHRDRSLVHPAGVSIGKFRRLILGMIVFSISLCCLQSDARADGEPAAAFLRQLRAAGYYDTAGLYLDRLAKYPGVDPELVKAVPLEKAQNFIEPPFHRAVARTARNIFRMLNHP